MTNNSLKSGWGQAKNVEALHMYGNLVNYNKMFDYCFF